MLATYVIGLREGLEAALIVGIIAAFLKNNGRRLTGMWIGVVLAVALSIGVGVVLSLVEQSLPQAAQEAMETVIGAVAIFFVTGMLVWMNRHARSMRSELEEHAGAALKDGHAWALALMAFLAVLKEGFETSVFLLATFSASTDAALAALGASLGVLTAIAVGIGIYLGGVRINLSRFFRVTGGFLILVAAGLVVSTLRTAHEAGWLTGGQQRTVDLSAIVTPGSIPSALITGVLGIPADPRLIEVVGWFAYLIPVALFVFWPRAARPRADRVPRLQAALGAAAAVVAIALAVSWALPTTTAPGPLTLAAGASGTDGATTGTASLAGTRLTIALDGSDARTVTLDGPSTSVEHEGVNASQWTWTDDDSGSGPATLSLEDLATLSGGRLPIGINRAQQPGPFAAHWQISDEVSVWTAEGVLLDASSTRDAIVTLSGGGLTTERSVTVTGADLAHPDAGWHGATAEVSARAALAEARIETDNERLLWGVQVPAVLAVAAIALLLAAWRGRRRTRAHEAVEASPAPFTHPAHAAAP
ncbi:iron uptake transporter permease EfeU [Microbacterium trichothecenolyticum]|uniref:High-affinity iron transporter n=1 Tax=Microbacterium trichothecenolyticum TaxID=69370 RepID=A0ABU0TSU8_MICTR|nr:iron uptake transporter permease EfeU [Microbacterium trichothecenolyticum]MDQ1122736.1 high-affinity iron transporter [Microbacterium trichothecenolyticum]